MQSIALETCAKNLLPRSGKALLITSSGPSSCKAVTRLKSALIVQKDVRYGPDFCRIWKFILAIEDLHILDPFFGEDANQTYLFEKLNQINE
jgi:hypothetical protein